MSQPDFEIPPAADAPPRPGFAAESADFMSTVAVHLGLALAPGEALAPGHPFDSPTGFACRIHVMDDGERAVGQPHLLLPMSAHELAGDEVVRLMKVQASLMAGLGLWLGLSDNGLLQMHPLAWSADAAEVVQLLDAANGVAADVLRAIALGEEQSP